MRLARPLLVLALPLFLAACDSGASSEAALTRIGETAQSGMTAAKDGLTDVGEKATAVAQSGERAMVRLGTAVEAGARATGEALEAVGELVIEATSDTVPASQEESSSSSDAR